MGTTMFGAIQPQLTLGEYVAHGLMGAGSRMEYAIGTNPDINGAVSEDVWQTGGTYVFPSAAMRMEVVSSSAQDAAGGSGASTVCICYLDSTYTEYHETVTLTGQTAVPTTATNILRINSMKVSGPAGQVAAGTISLRHLDNTPAYSVIVPGDTRTRNMAYTVPKGYSLQFSAFAWASSAADKAAYLKFTFKANYDNETNTVNGVDYPIMEISVQNTGIVYTMPTPLVLPQYTDTHMVCVGNAATASCTASCSWRGILIPM